jgi:hypothetical protein
VNVQPARTVGPTVKQRGSGTRNQRPIGTHTGG